MKKPLIKILMLGGILSFNGCSSYRTTAILPERRPLGKEFPAMEATDLSINELEEKSEKIEILSLRKALALSLLKNPKLAVFSYEIRAREARILQASLLPNPELGIEVENFAGSGDMRGFDFTETTISIGQLIELAGKRSKRAKLTALESDLAAWDYEAIRLDVFTEVVKAFIEVFTGQQRVSLGDELVKLAEQFLQTINRRVEAGKVSPAEAARAKVELSSTRIELERAKLELQAALRRLSATWGSSDPGFSQVIGVLDTTVTLPQLEKMQALIEQNPDMARWVVEKDQRQAALELENAGRIPDPTISGGLRKFNETGDNAFVMGLSFPLPLFSRNQGNIREAEYRKRQAEHQRKATEIAIKTQLSNVYQIISAAYNEVYTLKTDVLPEAQKAFSVINEGYLKGKFGFLEVLDSQRTLFETRSHYLNALRDYHLSLADLERLIGQKINSVE